MQNDSKYIPGVYNYCDRWCERCPFAMRCRNFAMELAGDDLELEIGDNEAFWEGVTESYDDAMGFLDKGDWEIDEKEFAEFMDEQQSVEVLTRNHPIAIDRSIGAWNVLRKLLPDQQQAIVGFLRMLSRLRHDTEAAFPNARLFVRPGFDEV